MVMRVSNLINYETIISVWPTRYKVEEIKMTHGRLKKKIRVTILRWQSYAYSSTIIINIHEVIILEPTLLSYENKNKLPY